MKICISHCHNDLTFVIRLVDALREAGETVHFNSGDKPGAGQDNINVKELRQADVLIAVLSDASVVSTDVMDDVALAIALEKIIIPIKIGDCDVPLFLRSYQYIAYYTEEQGKGFDRFIRDLHRLLSKPDEKLKEVRMTMPPPMPVPAPSKGVTSRGKSVFSEVFGSLADNFRRIVGKGGGSEARRATEVFNKDTVKPVHKKSKHQKKSGPIHPKTEISEPKNGDNALESDVAEETGPASGPLLGQESTIPSKNPQTGVLAHSIPTKMQLQNTHRCIIRIGFDEVTIIKDFPERNHEIVVKKDIRVSDVMEVEFLQNPHFEITALNNIKQPVDTYEHTEWNFDVMPKTVGEFPLTFKISIFLPNGSKEMILRETVSVITQSVPSGEVFIPSELMTLAEYYKMLHKELKIVTLFLASSSELADDRRAFEIMIARKNKNLIKENIYLELIIWEDFMDAMSASRLQDQYNKAISGCDVFISLFYTKVGKYTEEEFLRALEAFQLNKRPLIYTYFKDTEVKQASLVNFQQRLSDMGHFYTRFKDTDDLNYQFGEQLVKFLPLVK